MFLLKCVCVCVLACVPLQDLSNKDMKRDLYIVSQVIRTGEAPAHLPTAPHTHFIGDKLWPAGQTWPTASLYLAHCCYTAQFKHNATAPRMLCC